ncbi:MAG TPA: MFS transporter [Burkholderiales bacterium]|nr:MFS transporter [Burkholderiales bacterium]
MSPASGKDGRLLLAVLTGVQFTHIMDFMVMMPLGPQLMRLWRIEAHQFGLLVSAYTITAAVSALLCAFYVDRFDRRRVLLALYAGFVLATLLCALSPSYPALLAARACAGAFGGVSGSTVYSILADTVPDARRGAALGTVAVAFPLSAVAGVPFGLTLANLFDWRAPFFFLCAASGAVWLLAARAVPPLRGHVVQARERDAFAQVRAVFTQANHRRAFALIAILTFGGFSVIPFIAPYMVANVHLKETDLPWLYFFGGLATVFTSRRIGALADRRGKRETFAAVASVSILPLLITTNLPPVPVWAAISASVLFMVFVSGRFVPAMAIVTAAAQPQVRGSFLSLNSAVQQLASGAASISSGYIIGRAADGALTRFWMVGLVAATCTLICVWLARRIQAVS